jgi:hypothetical protein
MARRCVWSRNLENEEAKARYRAVKIQQQWVVTPGKQTNKLTLVMRNKNMLVIIEQNYIKKILFTS